jgi:hypothetical protein
MRMNGNDRIKASAEDREKYIKAWQEMMITIWHEKITRLHVLDTTHLFSGINGAVIGSGGSVQTIMHKFLEYGIYQDCGTGRGYKKGNGGNLEFLDPLNSKRARVGKHQQASGKETRYGDHRKPREWFSRSYFASVMVLKEQIAYMYAEEFTGIVIDAISSADTGKSTSMRSYLWGHHRRRH